MSLDPALLTVLPSEVSIPGVTSSWPLEEACQYFVVTMNEASSTENLHVLFRTEYNSFFKWQNFKCLHLALVPKPLIRFLKIETHALPLYTLVTINLEHLSIFLSPFNHGRWSTAACTVNHTQRQSAYTESNLSYVSGDKHCADWKLFLRYCCSWIRNIRICLPPRLWAHMFACPYHTVNQLSKIFPNTGPYSMYSRLSELSRLFSCCCNTNADLLTRDCVRIKLYFF